MLEEAGDVVLDLGRVRQAEVLPDGIQEVAEVGLKGIRGCMGGG